MEVLFNNKKEVLDISRGEAGLPSEISESFQDEFTTRQETDSSSFAVHVTEVDCGDALLNHHSITMDTREDVFSTSGGESDLSLEANSATRVLEELKICATQETDCSSAENGSAGRGKVKNTTTKRQALHILIQRRDCMISAIVIIILLVFVVAGTVFGPKATNAPSLQPTTSTAPSQAVVTIAPSDPFDPYEYLIRTKAGSTGLDDETSSQSFALKWVAENPPQPLTYARVIQAFGLVTILHGMGLVGGLSAADICSSSTVTNCTHDGFVQELHLAHLDLDGSILTEIGLLPTLQVLDVGYNNLRGTLPTEFYRLTNMTYLYMNSNQLSGTLSDDMIHMRSLQQVYLGNNHFTGSFPEGLISTHDNPRPLKFISVFNNLLSGSIPDKLWWRDVFYVDFSFNRLNGTLPSSMFDDFVEVRHLYLDHNRFTSSVPKNLPLVGGGRLIELTLDSNFLTGEFPDKKWDVKDKNNKFLSTLKIQNNRFDTKLGNGICDMAVMTGNGELTDLGADCRICRCKTGCELCTPDNIFD